MSEITHDNIIIKIEEHDRHIDTLSRSIEALADTNGATNIKIDKLIDTIGKHNVLSERVSNIDKNIIDSFARRDARLDALESVQKETGCSKVQLAEASLKGIGRSIDKLREDHHEDKLAAAERMKTVTGS